MEVFRLADALSMERQINRNSYIKRALYWNRELSNWSKQLFNSIRELFNSIKELFNSIIELSIYV